MISQGVSALRSSQWSYSTTNFNHIKYVSFFSVFRPLMWEWCQERYFASGGHMLKMCDRLDPKWTDEKERHCWCWVLFIFLFLPFHSRGICVCEQWRGILWSTSIYFVLSGSVTLGPDIQPSHTFSASASYNTPWNYGAPQALWSKWLISHHLFCVLKPFSISKTGHCQQSGCGHV